MARRPSIGVLLVALATTIATTTGAAQSVGLRAVAADVRHPLLGGLLGGAAEVMIPLGAQGLELALGGEHLVGRSRRVGAPCGGFPPPGTCGPEAVRDDGRSTALSAGVRLPVGRDHPIALRVGGGLAVAFVSNTRHGLVSGTRLTASKALWRADVEAEASWRPWPAKAVALVGGAGAGWQMPIRNEQVLDGYTPFTHGARVLRAWLGASWRLARH